MMRSRPDVLVLGAGGVLGEAWMMGVLAGIEDGTGFDLRDCDYYVGTSAGAIVAAHLVAGQPPAARRRWAPTTRLPPPRVRSTGSPQPGWRPRGAPAPWRSPPARRSPRSHSAWPRPVGRWHEPCSCGGCPAPKPTLSDLRRNIERLEPRFDGRLRVTAVDRGNGRRVVFGSPGAPRAERRRRRSRRRAPCPGCSRRSRSAAASTSTAASGARPTSTPRPPAATRTCCA